MLCAKEKDTSHEGFCLSYKDTYVFFHFDFLDFTQIDKTIYNMKVQVASEGTEELHRKGKHRDKGEQ